MKQLFTSGTHLHWNYANNDPIPIPILQLNGASLQCLKLRIYLTLVELESQTSKSVYARPLLCLLKDVRWTDSSSYSSNTSAKSEE